MWASFSHLTRLPSNETKPLPHVGHLLHAGAQDQGKEQHQGHAQHQTVHNEVRKRSENQEDFCQSDGLHHHNDSAAEAAASWTPNQS